MELDQEAFEASLDTALGTIAREARRHLRTVEQILFRYDWLIYSIDSGNMAGPLVLYDIFFGLRPIRTGKPSSHSLSLSLAHFLCFFIHS